MGKIVLSSLFVCFIVGLGLVLGNIKFSSKPVGIIMMVLALMFVVLDISIQRETTLNFITHK